MVVIFGKEVTPLGCMTTSEGMDDHPVCRDTIAISVVKVKKVVVPI